MDDIKLMDAQEKNTNIAKCPSCGANTAFDPAQQILKCAHCGSTVDFNRSEKAQELAIEQMMTQSAKWDNETHAYRCDNCGAKQLLARNEIAKECTYCGATNIVETKELSGIKPNAVVPFKITHEKASENYLAWIKKKFFAPKVFKQNALPEDMKGIYNPGFTFDANTVSKYEGTLGKHYYKTVKGPDGKPRQVRETRYFRVSGVYNDMFDDILIQASNRIDQKTLDQLAPFNTNQSKLYSESFLAGFAANANDKEGMACWGEARRIIDSQVRSRILRKYTYDVVQSFSVSTQCSNVKYKYIMLPLYVGKCSWKQKLYNFFVNGFSGKVTGKAPVSGAKVTITAVIGTILFAGIAGLVYYFMSK